ncbi:MAG: RNA degradosome polyphosphate kinase, partial [Gammaproteobacteria bacterium]
VVGYKTHCKVIFVLRRDYDGLRRYAHIGTGNYHAGTARIYSDLGMFTCDPEIGQDLTELFNFLTSGQGGKRAYRKLLPAPVLMKRGLLDKIEREIKKHSQDSRGLIQFKTNALEDKDISKALYQASQAGVKADLLVRDSCRVRPGIPGLSENIRVLSIVGRFLEHARIYYFKNGGEEEYFIGSADLMKRNLESRVEVLAPVEKKELRALLRQCLDAQLQDTRSAWEMQSDASYRQCRPGPEEDGRGAQQVFTDLAAQRWQDHVHNSARDLFSRRTAITSWSRE